MSEPEKEKAVGAAPSSPSSSSSTGLKASSLALPPAPPPPPDVSAMSSAELVRYVFEQEQRKLMEKRAAKQAKMEKSEKDEHRFWDTQPMLSFSSAAVEAEANGPIDPSEDVSLIRAEPYGMPQGFTWCDMDVMDPTTIGEMYKLLADNYVEDDDAMFRFDYSREFLQWALTPPGYSNHLHVGVRTTAGGKLMGAITAIPLTMSVNGKEVKMVEINFLCVHKKLRANRLAPVLIKEVTRRVNLMGRWQAIYTAGVLLPKPIARCRYWHRSLQFKKLCEVKFTYLPPQMTMSGQIKNLAVPKAPVHAWREMAVEDVSAVTALLQTSLTGRKLHQIFSDEEVRHVFLPIPGIVRTWVLGTGGPGGVVTDMCGFYHLHSSIMGHPQHKTLCAVYSYYNVAKTMSLQALYADLLIMAYNSGADVFNALDVMDNESVFEDLKFGQGDGFLHYYVYNWRCPQLEPGQVGMVLV